MMALWKSLSWSTMQLSRPQPGCHTCLQPCALGPHALSWSRTKVPACHRSHRNFRHHRQDRQQRRHASHRSSACRAQQDGSAESSTNLVSTAGLLGLWIALAAFAFVLSPNQTPYRDIYLIQKLVGLGENDGVKINTVVTQMFYLMAVWPGIYASLLLPSAKSGNKVPAWPFVVGSFAFGIFALAPYFALWEPPKEKPQAPPTKADLGGWPNLGVKATESPITAWLLLVSAVACLSQAALAGGEAWAGFLRYFDESRAVHATAIDFAALTVVAPTWMWNDAQVRQWEGRDRWLAPLSFLPVIGPAVYLVLRPKAK